MGVIQDISVPNQINKSIGLPQIRNNGLPEPLYLAIMRRWYDGKLNGKTTLSVTSMKNGLKSIILTKRHNNEVVKGASSMVAALLGSALHYILERSNENPAYHDIENIVTDILNNELNGVTPNTNAVSKSIISKITSFFNSPRFATLNKIKNDLIKKNRFIVERRFYFKFMGEMLSGGVDLIDTQANTIEDWKLTGVNSFAYIDNKMDDYSFQLNSYRLLIKNNNYRKINVETAKMYINQIYKDWSMLKYEKNKDKYPFVSERIEMPLIKDSNIYAMWADKIDKMHAIEKAGTPDDEIPNCSAEERWQRPSIFKIYGKTKSSNYTEFSTRAIKTVSRKSEAEALVHNYAQKKAMDSLSIIADVDDYNIALDKLTKENLAHYKITEILSEPLKCLYFCDVKHWCSFYRDYVKEYGEPNAD